MMRSVAFTLFLVLMNASMAQAGAWLRKQGDGFAATSVTTNEDSELSTSIYLEYGLNENATLGLDVDYGVDLTNTQQGSGILFLRFPLGPTDQTHKWAAHVGIGARYMAGYYGPATELGLSWGRGIKWGERYGWVNIDSSYNIPQSPFDNRVKIDGTIGLGISERSKVMVQSFNTTEDGRTFSKVAPSYLFTPASGQTTFQFSVEIPIAGGGSNALKIGIWREF